MLSEIFKSLDNWIKNENLEALEDGVFLYRNCEFRIVGQTALLEASLHLDLAATADVDVFTNASHAIKAKLNEMLNIHGMFLDPLSDEIWMPIETRYVPLFSGDLVEVLRAEPEFVLLSKASKAMDKNKILLLQYLAESPSPEFFQLCEKYSVDLSRLVRR